MKVLAALHQRSYTANPTFDELTLTQFEAILKSASTVFGIRGFWITPLELRHGAPSTGTLEGCINRHGPADQGRWGSEVSCRIYKQPGKLMPVASRMSGGVRDLAEKLMADQGGESLPRPAAVYATLLNPRM